MLFKQHPPGFWDKRSIHALLRVLISKRQDVSGTGGRLKTKKYEAFMNWLVV